MEKLYELHRDVRHGPGRILIYKQNSSKIRLDYYRRGTRQNSEVRDRRDLEL